MQKTKGFTDTADAGKGSERMSPEEIQKRNTMMRDMLDKVHAGFMELLGDKDNLEAANAELKAEVARLKDWMEYFSTAAEMEGDIIKEKICAAIERGENVPGKKVK